MIYNDHHCVPCVILEPWMRLSDSAAAETGSVIAEQGISNSIHNFTHIYIYIYIYIHTHMYTYA